MSTMSTFRLLVTNYYINIDPPNLKIITMKKKHINTTQTYKIGTYYNINDK